MILEQGAKRAGDEKWLILNIFSRKHNLLKGWVQKCKKTEESKTRVGDGEGNGAAQEKEQVSLSTAVPASTLMRRHRVPAEMHPALVCWQRLLGSHVAYMQDSQGVGSLRLQNWGWILRNCGCSFNLQQIFIRGILCARHGRIHSDA